MKIIIRLLIIYILLFVVIDNTIAQKKQGLDIIDQHKYNVHISVPKGFRRMTKQELDLKDQSFITPTKAYTSQDTRADIFIKETPSPFTEESTDLMIKFYKSNLMSFFDKIEWIESKMIKIKGQNFSRLVFISHTKPPKNHLHRRTTIKKYTIVHAKIKGEKKINIIFSFPPQEKEKWLKIAEKTMKSIKI